MAVTFTQAEVDAFKAALLKNPGVLEMDIGDRHYKFASLKEMEERLAYMQRNIAGGAAGRIRYVSTSKGF
jgi:hypothetical protein